MSKAPPDAGPNEPSARTHPSWLRWLHSAENGLVVLVLAGLVLFPLVEIFLRKFTNKGITGSSAFVQHFTLLVGVLGGAIAAREGRLLSLSTMAYVLPGGWKSAALIFSNSLAAAISGVLCLAGWKWMQVEIGRAHV